jgi:membrane metallo-endopeptidase-like protein 1
MFDALGEEINMQGRKLLEDEPSPEDFDSYQLARDFYKSCTDEEKREELGIKPILDKLNEFGGWPVVDGKKWQQEDSFKWWEWNHVISRNGFESNSLILVDIEADSKNTSWYAITIDQASLGMPREYLIKGFEDIDVQYYYKYMVDTAVLLGAESESALNELKESLLFEISLANITVPKEERQNASVLYNPTTLGELPNLDVLPPSWVTYVQTLFEKANKVTIKENEKIILTNLEFFYKLSNLLKSTNPRILANYLAWQTVKSSMASLNKAAHAIKLSYDKAIRGIKELPPLWKMCTNAIGFNKYVGLSSLGLVAGSMYAKNFSHPSTKKDMLEMTSYLRKAFKEDMLEKIDWMDDVTKKKAIEKLEVMDQLFGFEDELLDKKIVDGLLRNVKISKTDFFENELYLNQFWKTFKYNRLREPIDPKSWLEHTDIAVANGFDSYKEWFNTLEFPAGILQGTFYNPNIPKYMNFGSIGAIIGHEIIHGFDDIGKQRNGIGKIFSVIFLDFII